MRHEGTSIQRGEEKIAPSLGRERRREGERESEEGFGSSFYVSLSLGLSYVKLGQPRVLFVLPDFLTPVLRPSFVLFSRIFPFQVF